MTTAHELLHFLREAPPMDTGELAAWLYETGFDPTEIDVVTSGAAVLRDIARELERLETPALPDRRYPSIDACSQAEKKLPRPIQIAAQYEARARDFDRLARHWASRLHEPGARMCLEGCIAAADADMRAAEEVLARAAREVRRAAA